MTEISQCLPVVGQILNNPLLSDWPSSTNSISHKNKEICFSLPCPGAQTIRSLAVNQIPTMIPVCFKRKRDAIHNREARVNISQWQNYI